MHNIPSNKSILKAVALLTLTLLSACTSTTGVLDMGGGRLMVTGWSERGTSFAQAAAVRRANRHAQEQGKELRVLSHKTSLIASGAYPKHNYELQFKLVEPGSPGDVESVAPSTSLAVDTTLRSARPPVGLEDQLRRLDKLLEDGILSVEEFDTIKARLIQDFAKR